MGYFYHHSKHLAPEKAQRATFKATEALNFKGDQIRLAMGKTGGYDARAPLEWLLVNLPKQETSALPRAKLGCFGGLLTNYKGLQFESFRLDFSLI